MLWSNCCVFTYLGIIHIASFTIAGYIIIQNMTFDLSFRFLKGTQRHLLERSMYHIQLIWQLLQAWLLYLPTSTTTPGKTTIQIRASTPVLSAARMCLISVLKGWAVLQLIQQNGSSQMTFYTGGPNYHTGAGTAIFHCAESDSVRFVISGGTIRGIRSNFSGFLLHADPV